MLPEADEVEVDIDEDKDLRIEVKRSSGPGGQSVNTTDSAVRITHLPTGLVVEIQDEKSQHKNKAKALAVLRARLLERSSQAARGAIRARRSMVGSGDRSEKIRTYNFPQDRVTDHRIVRTVHNLPGVLDGDLDDLIDALTMADQAERLAAVTEHGGERWRAEHGRSTSLDRSERSVIFEPAVAAPDRAGDRPRRRPGPQARATCSC